jgi:C4-dicarboxylate-specific signal transduction histidine kinase
VADRVGYRRVRHIRTLAKKDMPHKMPLQLNDVVNDVVSLTRHEVLSHRVSLRLKLASALPPLLGDRVQLQQVILNLVMNGIQAMDGISDRPRELHIESHEDKAAKVVIAVQDSGVGISPKMQIDCSMRSSARGPTGWAWDCQSGAGSLKPMRGG